MFAGALLDRGEINTGSKGGVALGLANANRLRIGPATELRLRHLRHEHESAATELELLRGEIECLPTDYKARDRGIIVHTEIVLVQADGARFSLRHAPDKQTTTISAATGSVRIERRDGSAPMTLSQGQQISVRKSDKGLPPAQGN
jgi:hypothetical protein